MKNSILLTLVICFISCYQSAKVEAPKPEVPKALQENTSSIGFTKRGAGNLVSEIYAEQVEGVPSLKELENSIDNLNEITPDSLNIFNRYNQKNRAYYADATDMLHEIKDSVLRIKIQEIVTKSLNNYNSKIAGHAALIASVDLKKMALNDLHNALKLVKSLPVIEQFQQQNLPSKNGILKVIADYNKTIKTTDSLVTQ